MGLKSRVKGKRGERELAQILTEKGFPSRRGQQFQGSPDSPDVVSSSSMLEGFHIEVKRAEALSLYKAMAQAVGDSKGEKTPIVAHRRNNTEWVVVLRLDDFLDLLRSVWRSRILRSEDDPIPAP